LSALFLLITGLSALLLLVTGLSAFLLLVTVLSALLRFTASDYSFGISKLFLLFCCHRTAVI
jgi:hypothetical protein